MDTVWLVDEAERPRWLRFGHWLADRRKETGRTATELAGRAGISSVQWSRIENGESGTRTRTVAYIAEALGLPVGEVLSAAGFAGEGPDIHEIAREAAREAVQEINRERLESTDEDDMLDRLLIHQGKQPPTDPKQREMLKRAMRGLADLADPLEPGG